ncbi:hypothetical protein ACJMK2_044069 [Sinanodonta woodiana]|uniref:Uncharacterized protein n=1 Tax=Sinanodonta woodiana TaxID=1069815 RepID=A0ABD3W052_SINWO
MEWRCTVRRKANSCSVLVKQRGEIFTCSHHSHTHPSMPGSLVADKMKSKGCLYHLIYIIKLKTLAFGDMFGSAPAMVDDILHKYGAPLATRTLATSIHHDM